MKKVSRRILSIAVSLTITGAGIGTYVHQTENPFDPDNYSRNTELNRNQITFEDDQKNDKYADTSNNDAVSEEKQQMEQDPESDRKQNAADRTNSSILFETQVTQKNDIPALVTADETEAASENDLPPTSQAESLEETPPLYVLDESGSSSSGPSVLLPAGTGAGRGNTFAASGSGTGSTSGNRGDSEKANPTGGNSENGSTQRPQKPGSTESDKKPEEPDTPSEPEYNNSYTEKEPEIPEDIYDMMLPVKPMPEEGLDAAEAGESPELVVTALTKSFDADLIYYGQELDPWKLLCACNVHVNCGGTLYRVTKLNENFQITGFPDKAEENFTATFSFRLNAGSDWIRQEVEFPVQPYKLVLSNDDLQSAVNPKTEQYPEEDTSVDLLLYYQKMYRTGQELPMIGDAIQEIFLGWSENNGGKPIYYQYQPAKKGLNVLYPLGTAALPDDYTAEVRSIWDAAGNYCYVQALTGYSGTSRELLIPEGIQTAALTADVDRVVIPASVVELEDTLTVKDAYEVDTDNPVLASTDGVLYDRAYTELYAVPYGMSSVTVPETVEKITLSEQNCIQSLTLHAETPPEIELRRLENATIYVPDDAYFSYVKKWALRLGTNRILPQSDNSESSFYTKANAILTDTADGTALCGVTEQVKGIYVVPEGVTEIRENAFDGCDLKTLILPASLQKLDSGALQGLDETQIFFLGQDAPAAEADSFSQTALHVPAACRDSYAKQWEAYGVSVSGEEFAVCETDGFTYFQESDGATLLHAPEDLVHFRADSLPDISLKAIGSRAFSDCPALQTAELPEETKTLLPGAFEDCNALEQIVSLSQDQLSIGTDAFANCMMLYCVACNAESAVMEDGYEPGNNCYFYQPYDSYGYASCFREFIYRYRMVYGENDIVSVYGDSGEEHYLMSVTSGLSGVCTLESNTIEIAPGAFSRCQNPFTIAEEEFCQVMFIDVSAFENSGIAGALTLSENFCLLGDGAFRNCANLEAVHFETGETCRTIPSNAFYGCVSLGEVTFGENSSIQMICDSAFADTALQTFTIPASVTEIYYNIFGGCDALEEIHFAGETPPGLILYNQGSTFQFQSRTDGTANAISLLVPADCRQAYYEEWQYLYAGFSDLDELCSYYYMLSIWDNISIEETTQTITEMLRERQQELWDLLQCEGTAPEPDSALILEKLNQAEEEMNQW